MNDLKPYALNVLFRANHNAMWELAEKAGIMAQMNLSIASLELSGFIDELMQEQPAPHQNQGSAT